MQYVPNNFKLNFATNPFIKYNITFRSTEGFYIHVIKVYEIQLEQTYVLQCNLKQ